MSLEAYYEILWVWASSSFMKQKSGFFVYALPFSTQAVLLHLEIMAPKKRKRQSIRDNAANVVAAQTSKTTSHLALWMERFFIV